MFYDSDRFAGDYVLISLSEFVSAANADELARAAAYSLPIECKNRCDLKQSIGIPGGVEIDLVRPNSDGIYDHEVHATRGAIGMTVKWATHRRSADPALIPLALAQYEKLPLR